MDTRTALLWASFGLTSLAASLAVMKAWERVLTRSASYVERIARVARDAIFFGFVGYMMYAVAVSSPRLLRHALLGETLIPRGDVLALYGFSQQLGVAGPIFVLVGILAFVPLFFRTVVTAMVWASKPGPLDLGFLRAMHGNTFVKCLCIWIGHTVGVSKGAENRRRRRCEAMKGLLSVGVAFAGVWGTVGFFASMYGLEAACGAYVASLPLGIATVSWAVVSGVRHVVDHVLGTRWGTAIAALILGLSASLIGTIVDLGLFGIGQ